MVPRKYQFLLIGTYVPFCWLAMMVAHECGHMMAALVTGGTVTKVVLHPLAISRTDVLPNPMPIVVAWAGPVVGIWLPMGIWWAHRMVHATSAYMTRFYAGFCLVANGAYLGVGAFGAVGDAGDLLRLGVPRWGLWLFGGLAVAAGLALWNRLGPHFGFGASGEEVSPVTAWVSAVLLATTVVVMIMIV